TAIDPAVLAHAYGGRGKPRFKLLNAAALQIPYRHLQHLAQHPGVAWVSPDRALGGQWDYDTEAMGVPQVWAGAAGVAGYKGTGAAPDADLVAVKVLGKDGSGAVSTVIAGLDWCVQNKTLYNIRVLNLSLGLYPKESFRTDPLCLAVRRAVQAGLVVCCSAGNR